MYNFFASELLENHIWVADIVRSPLFMVTENSKILKLNIARQHRGYVEKSIRLGNLIDNNPYRRLRIINYYRLLLITMFTCGLRVCTYRLKSISCDVLKVKSGLTSWKSR